MSDKIKNAFALHDLFVDGFKRYQKIMGKLNK